MVNMLNHIDIDAFNPLNSLEATVEIKMDSEYESRVIFDSISPELESSPSSRATMKMDREGSTLYLKIHARDAPSFRASLNSSIRWIILSLEMLNLLKS
ncbi:KEOPS complex subunit Pcc1 [Methanobacterium movens]